MSSSVISANSVAAAISEAKGQVLPLGGRTKSALAACGTDVTRLDMRSLNGIVTYDPSEFLITALAGTPLSVLQSSLSEKGQYLPFDPLFAAEGSTIGGTLAAGISGPNRLLYGGLRDFVMEIELVDGLGKQVRGGGKVVKNAAGFDLPKLMVGSYGRLGIITEVTLKVFPEPQAFATLRARFASLDEGLQAVWRLLAKPLPLSALDITSDYELLVRCGGPADALSQVLSRAADLVNSPCEAIISSPTETQLWRQRSASVTHHGRSNGQLLIRVATTLRCLSALAKRLEAGAVNVICYSCAGSVAWLSIANADCELLDSTLQSLNLSAVAVCGSTESLFALGDRRWMSVASRVQRAMDPQHKFLPFGSAEPAALRA